MGVGASPAADSPGVTSATGTSAVLRKTFLALGFGSSRGLTCLGLAVSDDVVEVLRVFLFARACCSEQSHTGLGFPD